MVVTDNVNVLQWIRKRAARNLYAQALLRLITRLEIQHGFQVWTEDIRSGENNIPDCLSRLHTRSRSLDHTQVQRWEELMGHLVSRISIVEPTFAFPEVWFDSRDPSRWTMPLPIIQDESATKSQRALRRRKPATTQSYPPRPFVVSPATILPEESSFKCGTTPRGLPVPPATSLGSAAQRENTFVTQILEAITLLESHVLAPSTVKKY